MAADPTLLVQKAIFEKLSADATLANLIEGIFDHVPQGTSEPYVTIGNSTQVPFDTHESAGMDETHTIHTWAKGSGSKNCREIMAEVYRILHDSSLTVVGFKTMFVLIEFADCALDPDGQTYHGVQRFRIILGGE